MPRRAGRRKRRRLEPLEIVEVLLPDAPMTHDRRPLTATAERARPPSPMPSSFVRMTPVSPTALWNASALRPALWPIAASRTSRVSSGWRVLDPRELRDQIGVDAAAAGRVDDDREVGGEPPEGVPDDHLGAGLAPMGVELGPDLLRELLQLVDGRRAVDVGRDETDADPLLLEGNGQACRPWSSCPGQRAPRAGPGAA